MSKKTKSIPVNPAAGEFEAGIAIIGRISVKDLDSFEEFEESHRDNFHLFLLQESGTTGIEIDFQTYKIQPSSLLYIHPNQIHRLIGFENVTFSGWAIDNENLNPEYLKLLEDITPVKPLLINEDTFSIISDTITLCMNFSERNHEKLYNSILKESCNVLIGLTISQYLEHTKTTDSLSRFDTITKAFKGLLERNFISMKKPVEYAERLNISTAYLNECVKNTTGFSVTYHIQQRIILEAKRMLYHSDKSAKEIAADLGYDDYPYFSRLFSKVTGITPLGFRNKNHE
ncbi:AraC-like protein [Flavobacterium sp. 90]|uniref:helix-turn-helix domain-containing protein n=1 Tax=unclassified Flavobacterium TaxID=196869 RepID=UPI000EAD1E7B|nr:MULTISPECIES: helix-turn-helix domain-containing protein [unclassified Flavobacterium]RKR05369.1 AraC-like protein [Flavobacterium sp. 81]TCK56684.1 AraC-like protein [Flavobacterium sp. 90]